MSQDTDFYAHFEEINPVFYSIWVCPHCGYAAQDLYFETLSEDNTRQIETFLQGKDVKVDFCGARTLSQAMASYKLAIYYGEMLHLKSSRLALLYHKLAWLYRDEGKKQQEEQLLSKACDYYEEAMYNEKLPLGNLTEITLIYLTGELLRRTGNLDEALKRFIAVTSHPLAKSENRILQMAKDAWQETRNRKKELAKVEADRCNIDQATGV